MSICTRSDYTKQRPKLHTGCALQHSHCTKSFVHLNQQSCRSRKGMHGMPTTCQCYKCMHYTPATPHSNLSMLQMHALRTRATLHSKIPTGALVTATVAAYLELLLALIIGELLGLPVLGFRGLLAFLFLCSWVLPDSSMHLCMTH